MNLILFFCSKRGSGIGEFSRPTCLAKHLCWSFASRTSIFGPSEASCISTPTPSYAFTMGVHIFAVYNLCTVSESVCSWRLLARMGVPRKRPQFNQFAMLGATWYPDHHSRPTTATQAEACRVQDGQRMSKATVARIWVCDSLCTVYLTLFI